MRVVIATDRAPDRESFRKASLSLGMECDAADCLSLEDLRVRLTKPPRADLTLIGVEPGASAALQAIEGALQQTQIPILAVGPLADAQFIRRAQRAGAREYLDQDQLRDELSNAVEKLRTSGAVEFRQGRTVAVTSAHAGVGVSTIASGLAFSYATRRRGPVVLAELGTATPDLCLTLGLNPSHTVDDLVREPERLDVSMLRKALVAHPAGVELLGYKPGELKATAIQPGPMRHLVALLRAVSDIRVLDLGGSLTPAMLEAVKLADAVLVVVRLDVPGVRLAHEHLKALKAAGIPQESIKVVGNRYGLRGQVDWKSAEQALGWPVAEWLPEAPSVVNWALNKAASLHEAAPRAALVRKLNNVAEQLIPAPGRAGPIRARPDGE